MESKFIIWKGAFHRFGHILLPFIVSQLAELHCLINMVTALLGLFTVLLEYLRGMEPLVLSLAMMHDS